MANTTIKHSTIGFEKMDKNKMYVNSAAAATHRAKVDNCYQKITNEWANIQRSFSNLAEKSTGKVNEMFTEAKNAAAKRKKGAANRQKQLDDELNIAVQGYARALLTNNTINQLIKELKG